MAQTTAISTKELERQAASAFEGQTLKVMLCLLDEDEFTEEDTIADWKTVEVDPAGYQEFSTTIGVGSYSSSEGAYVLPAINAEFTVTDIEGLVYDRVVLYIDGETYPHSVIEESPNIALVQGQVQTYRISLRQSP